MSIKKSGPIYFHTPPAQAAVFPYQVLAAGETRAQAGRAMIRQRFYQHVLILTLEGGGQIETGGLRFFPEPDSLVWLDTSRQYAHGCGLDCGIWHYLWVGFRGFGLDDLWLGKFLGNPVRKLADPAPTRDLIQQIIARLAAPDGRIDALNSATIAQLIAGLSAAGGLGFDMEEDSLIAGLIGLIRQDLIRPWRIETLARQADLSPAQFHRRFRLATGTAPMAWIRHERINSAKPALAGSSVKIASIALSCGYSDPYHFSRDFKRVTGVSPLRFRQEGGM